jgi:imidazolonepropionase-like amidohydrolase
MLAEKRIPVTTTLALRDSYRDASGSERRVFGTPYGEETRRMFEQMLKTAAAFHAAGVPLVVGTDCCQGAQIGDPRLQPGARAIHEMDLPNRAGLQCEAILAAATQVAANALGVSETVGTIARKSC